MLKNYQCGVLYIYNLQQQIKNAHTSQEIALRLA